MRPEKFTKSIQPIIDKLFRLALRITGTKEDAEDTVQDVLYSVWQKREEWDDVENMEAYCFRSIRNKALDKLALKDNQNAPIADNFDYPLQDDDAQQKLEKEEQAVLIETQIARLPEKQRTIFQLREVEGMSYKEIAEIIGISEDQVKITLFRIRQKLKNYFEKIR
jgi:RNA polymerase sigma-70 factor (ECF subfamily)